MSYPQTRRFWLCAGLPLPLAPLMFLAGFDAGPPAQPPPRTPAPVAPHATVRDEASLYDRNDDATFAVVVNHQKIGVLHQVQQGHKLTIDLVFTPPNATAHEPSNGYHSELIFDPNDGILTATNCSFINPQAHAVGHREGADFITLVTEKGATHTEHAPVISEKDFFTSNRLAVRGAVKASVTFPDFDCSSGKAYKCSATVLRREIKRVGGEDMETSLVVTKCDSGTEEAELIDARGYDLAHFFWGMAAFRMNPPPGYHTAMSSDTP